MAKKLKRITAVVLSALLALSGITFPDTKVIVYANESDGVKNFGTTYYVDSSAGDDKNNGTSEDKAWKSLNKVNQTTYKPGDEILFKADGVWTGTLYPKGSGTEGAPIKIDMYGEGKRPLIQGNGADTAVYFYSQEYWEVRNLEITNYSETRDIDRRGIHVSGSSGGYDDSAYVYTHFVFEGLEIHDVSGRFGDSYVRNGGIIVWGEEWDFIVKDVTIKNNVIYSVDAVGIYLNGAYSDKSSGFLVEGNVIYDAGGDGALVLDSTGAIMQYNLVYETHKRSTGPHVPIWTFASKGTLIQYNEVFNTYPGGDAMAYDADYRSEGTIIQYNYSHNNAGGMALACNDGGNASYKNLYPIIRYNISYNDRGAVFNISGPVTGASFYNNTVYISEGLDTLIYLATQWNGWGDGTSFYNNILVNHGTGKGFTSSMVGAQYADTNSLGYILGASKNNVFDNNLYWGTHSDVVLAMDNNKIVEDPLLAAPETAGIVGKVGADVKDRDVIYDAFKLQIGSPAIGAGKLIDNNGGYDFWGTPLSDSKPNIGAYETAEKRS